MRRARTRRRGARAAQISRWLVRCMKAAQAKAEYARETAARELARDDAAARLMQSKWRMHHAWVKKSALSEARARIIMKRAALSMQCAWRARHARRELKRLKADMRATQARRVSVVFTSSDDDQQCFKSLHIERRSSMRFQSLSH